MVFQKRYMKEEIFCYHCQQSAEKALKAFLALKEQEIPRIHDLIVLHGLCCAIDPKFKDIEDACYYLTDFGAVMRYPFHPEISEADMQSALQNAEFVLSVIKELV